MIHILRRLLAVALLAASVPVVAHADVPSTITYEGQVLAGDGTPASGPVTIEIGIWDAASAGTRLYRERHVDTPLVNGVFNLRLGTGTTVSGALNADTFSKPDRWLELVIGGETLAPRQPFSSAAYAFRARDADRVGGLDATALMPRAGGTFTGLVTVAGPNGNGNIQLGALGSDPNYGLISALDANGSPRAQMFATTSGQGVASVFSPNGEVGATMGGGQNGGIISTFSAQGRLAGFLTVLSTGHGLLSVNDDQQNPRVIATASGGAGALLTTGQGGHLAVSLDVTVENADHGQVSVHDENSNTRGSMFVEPDGGGRIDILGAAGDTAVEVRAHTTDEGVIVTRGPNGNQNVVVSSVVNYPNNGAVAVLDANGNVQAAMVVNTSGRGEIFADVKNFVVDHPTRPGVRIVYSSLEGPEVAMYHRGVARLSEGRTTIVLPEHFAVLAVPETTTVQLTPASLDSLGVGVQSIAGDRIEIGELRGGRGSYDVHFLVHAVRRGYEDHAVLIGGEDLRASQPPRVSSADGIRPAAPVTERGAAARAAVLREARAGVAAASAPAGGSPR